MWDVDGIGIEDSELVSAYRAMPTAMRRDTTRNTDILRYDNLTTAHPEALMITIAQLGTKQLRASEIGYIRQDHAERTQVDGLKARCDGMIRCRNCYRYRHSCCGIICFGNLDM